jgi:hypothetical protein
MKTILSAALVLGICGLAVAQGEKADPIGTWKLEYAIGDMKKPDSSGKIVVAGIGASVCRQIFAELEKQGPATAGISPAGVFVRCAEL